MAERHKLRGLSLKRFSAVGKPAQEGATTTLIKSAEAEPNSQDKIDKHASLLTSETAGHQHGIEVRRCPHGMTMDCICGGDGYIVHVESSGGDWHSHPIAMNADGAWEIGATSGHTHDLDSALLQQRIDEKLSIEKGEPMTEQTKEQPTVDVAEFEKLQRIVALKIDERTFYDGLEGEDAADFLAKSGDERAALMKAATDADPVVYTSKVSGVEVRKSDGSALLALAKQNDEMHERNVALEKANETSRLEKRARDEFPNLPNEDGGLLTLIKAAESNPAAEIALKAANAANENLFKTAGVTGEPPVDDGSGDPEVELQTKAQELAKSDDITFSEALIKFGRTTEGRRLRERIDAKRPAITADVS